MRHLQNCMGNQTGMCCLRVQGRKWARAAAGSEYMYLGKLHVGRAQTQVVTKLATHDSQARNLEPGMCNRTRPHFTSYEDLKPLTPYLKGGVRTGASFSTTYLLLPRGSFQSYLITGALHCCRA